jgi:acyl dehydratase
VAIDASFIGREYPPSEPYPVGAGKIREFADAIGDPNPVYRDAAAAKAAGYRDVIAPPTFATILNITTIKTIVDDPDLGLDWDRVVHGEQTFEYERPVTAGDALVVTAGIENIMTRAGNEFLTVRARVDTVEGEPVLVSRALIVARREA